jgi:predicted RND superfamily exporter protein
LTFKRVVELIVDFSGRRPYVVLVSALAVLVATLSYASRLELHTELLELLPRDSPGFIAYEHQLGRTGGRSALLIIAQSPSRENNERFIDDLSAKLQSLIDARKHCVQACKGASCGSDCGPELISYVESGEKEVRQFFKDNKWLYVDVKDLQEADETLDRQIAIRSGLVSDLLDDDDTPAAPAGNTAAPKPQAPGGGKVLAPSGAAESVVTQKKSALGMDDFRARWEAQAKKHDDFPTGYFATEDGTMLGLRVISPLTGMGDRAGDTLIAKMHEVISSMGLASYGPGMKVGFAGDIANAVEEKDSLLSDAAWATGIAFVLLLGGVVVFFRSPWSLLVIWLPAFIGVGCAYTFAMARYGYVNSSGAFLGAIILGNGINYPIVLLARYREFRARGQGPAEARRDAVWNAFRAELVGALVGSIAYGSLTITRFRGFNQFGMIGFVGMLMVWLSMIPLVPALLVIIESIQKKLPTYLRDPAPYIKPDGSRGPITRLIARSTERYPYAFLGAAAAVAVFAATKLPAYLRDPWEYDFDKLGSRGSKVGGAGEWSNKAEKVFGGKMNIAGAMMLADSPEQVPSLKQQIEDNDAKDPQGRLIGEIATVYDLLPGGPDEQKTKLAVLDNIRDRLTPAVMNDLDDDERKRVEEIRPPETLHVLEPKDLPDLLRRRFEENNGKVGTVFYVKYKNNVSLSDGHNLLRIAKSTDNVVLPNGTTVQTASRATIFAEMIRSMERDGPLATLASFAAVTGVVLLATANLRGAFAVLSALVLGVLWTLGGAAVSDSKLNFLNFIALPITFGIGCEYPFNVYDRSRLLKGDVTAAVKRTGGAVALCSYTTIVGYSSLLFSDFQSLQSFGRLAMSGELACLSGALLVLPALLHVIGVLPKARTGQANDAPPPSGRQRAPVKEAATASSEPPSAA